MMNTDWAKESRIEFLKENPGFWSRLGLVTAPPVVENGKLVCRESVDLNLRRHKALYEQGIILHSCILPLGWIGVDEYDYEITDRILSAFFTELPNAYLLPRIKVDPPLEWLIENPEEVFVFSGGPADLEGIRASVEASRDPVSGAVLDGLTGLQSFSSKKWLRDAGEALKKLLLRLKQSPYADRIMGYHLAYGCCGETTLWGSWEEDWTHRGDFGISATRAFQAYAKEKGFEITAVPSVYERYEVKGAEDLSASSACALYSRFLSDANADAMEFFAKIVRMLEPQKPIGYFYGYQLEVADCSHAGHAGLERVLESPYIDFLAGPKGYYRVSPYDPGVGEAPTQSISLKKLWIDELDNRTHLCKDTDEKAQGATNLAQTKSVYWREMIKNLCNGQGFWFMDLGGGWFEDREILLEVKKIVEEKARLQTSFRHAKRLSEVLIVYDDQFFHQFKTQRELYSVLLPKPLAVIKECGAPVDIYRLSDLESLPLEGYKLVVFLNCIVGKREKLQNALDKIPQTTSVWWHTLPQLSSAGISLFDTECGGGIVTVETNGRRIVNASPETLSVESFRSILENAGVHLYSSAYSTVYATDCFIYIMAGKTVEQPIRLKTPRRCKEAFSNQVFEKSDSLNLTVPAGTGVFIEYIE